MSVKKCVWHFSLQEDCTLENVWNMGGLSILTSAPLMPPYVCFLCASKGQHEVRIKIFHGYVGYSKAINVIFVEKPPLFSHASNPAVYIAVRLFYGGGVPLPRASCRLNTSDQ